LFSQGERGIYFSPGEVNFLFAGPFTRRQLLVFKITSNALIGLVTSLFFTLLLRIHARWGVAAYVGLFLTFLFLQLFTTAIGRCKRGGRCRRSHCSGKARAPRNGGCRRCRSGAASDPWLGGRRRRRFAAWAGLHCSSSSSRP